VIIKSKINPKISAKIWTKKECGNNNGFCLELNGEAFSQIELIEKGYEKSVHELIPLAYEKSGLCDTVKLHGLTFTLIYKLKDEKRANEIMELDSRLSVLKTDKNYIYLVFTFDKGRK